MAEIPVAEPGSGYGGADRPLGVTILAVLQIIGGLLVLFGGAALMAVGTYLLGPLGALIGGVLLILGLFELVVGWGLWNMRPWAWLIAMILNIISIILSIVMFDIIGLIIPLIIVIYLNQPNIKSRFR